MYISREEVECIDRFLIDEFHYELYQLVFMAASFIAKAKKNESHMSIWCGPGNNGTDGLVVTQPFKTLG